MIHEGSRIRLTMVHLPAINTPQFDWARSRLPGRLQPVPPIHDPEVAGEAVFRAAREAPRELWVGGPTIQAILGTMVAPGLLDWMMARQAWDGQMTDEPAQDRPDNLFEPVEGTWAAQGRFRSVAKGQAVSASDSFVRGASAAAGVAVVGALIALARWRSQPRRLEGEEPEHARVAVTDVWTS